MDQIPCPDGYLLQANSPLASGHHALNQYLVRVEEAGWKIALKEINSNRNKDLKLATWKALLERMSWLADNNPASQCWSPMRGLAERIEKWTLSLSESDLIDLLERTAEVKGVTAPHTPMPHLLEYVEEHGLTPELSAAIRTFRDRVWEQSYTPNQVSLQLFRSRLDMLLWRDEWNAVDPKRCWSEQVRGDFRSMRGAERENWRRLLYSIHGDEGVRPAPRWLDSANSRIEAIGRDAFRERLLCWFQPLQPGSTQKLSREGSHLLRSLIWLAESSKDSELLAAVGKIPDVSFKPKNNGEKVIRAAAEATGRPDPPVKPIAPSASFDILIGRALQAALSPVNSMVNPGVAARIEIADGVVHVRGDLDSYEVHIATGLIFRASDGRQVSVASATFEGTAIAFPNLGGMVELLGNVLALAEDGKHAGRITVKP
jgi:hypothetical protein